MPHRWCSAIDSLANFKFFKGILLIPVVLPLSKLYTISRINFLVQRESTQGLV